MSKISITTFYRFKPLDAERVQGLKTQMETIARTWNLRGLVLLGAEGINLTVSGDSAAIERFKAALPVWLGTENGHFKDSISERHPFEIFTVKVKEEIVTMGRPDLSPESTVNGHLSPEQWEAALSDPETVVLDTRNDYEVAIGKFKGAVDLNTKEFSDFPERVRASGIPKDRKILMYCTGGIRCEKAILAMQELGYGRVFQLDGGILNYLERFPRRSFEGECFVFDYRVAVDQDLRPTQRYRLCPHCGQAADIPIDCAQCDTHTLICGSCRDSGVNTCTKNCAHHQARGTQSQKAHLQELEKRHCR